jgi:hypothetical protein
LQALDRQETSVRLSEKAYYLIKVIIAPRRGLFVADISITDLQKIFKVRMVLEG